MENLAVQPIDIVKPRKKLNLHLFLKLALGFLMLIFIVLFLFYVLKLIEPSSPPENIFFSNITDHQVTISWTTAKPTRGALFISKDTKFPLLPFLSKEIVRDDGEKNLRTIGFYTTHKITIGGLKPGTTVRFRIYQGWKRAYEGSFRSGPTLSSINNPSPVYGRVLKADKKPMIGALVYFSASSSAILSTMTNNDGRWSLDLGNLRTKDLKSAFKIASGSAERVIVQTGKAKFSAETKVGADKPWPDIILK